MVISGEYHLARRRHFQQLASANCETESVKLMSHLMLEWYEEWRSLMTDPHPVQPWLSERKPWLYDWQTDSRYFAYWDVLKCLELGLGGDLIVTGGLLPVPPSMPLPPTFDSDASDFFARANIVDIVQQNAINDLVLALKEANLWIKIFALYPFVGGTAVSHSYNLKSASYLIVWHGGIIHDANGITGNGVDGWANTGFDIMNTIFGSIAYGVYNRTSATDNNADIKTNVGPEYAIYSRYPNGNFLGISGSYGGHSVQEPNPDAKGFYVVSRESLSLYKAYKDGIQFGPEKTNAPDGPLTNDTFLLLGNPSMFCLHNLALAFISNGLTGEDVSAFNTAAAAFETALNRNN